MGFLQAMDLNAFSGEWANGSYISIHIHSKVGILGLGQCLEQIDAVVL